MQPLPSVDVEIQDDVPVVHVRGEIDTSNIAHVGDALSAAASADRAPGTVVDLSAVTYLNSATVKLLFDLAEQLRQRQQQLRLVMTEAAPMRKLLLLLKLDMVVPLHGTVREAVRQIQADRKAGG